MDGAELDRVKVFCVWHEIEILHMSAQCTIG